MDALIAATSESLEATQSSLVTKSEFAALRSAVNEKIFNNGLKYDLQQKHMREMFKSEVDAIRNDLSAQRKTMDADIAAFRSDIRMTQKTDLFALQHQLNKIEKDRENEQTRYKSEHEALENRLIKYALSFVVSVFALVLTAIRLLNVS